MRQTPRGAATPMGMGKPEEEELGGRAAGGAWATVWPAPPPALQCQRMGSPHVLLSASTSQNICFFSGWGWGEKRRKKARGDRGLPFRLSTLARPSVIECSFPVTGPAQRGPFTGSPSRLPGNQVTASAPRPLNSNSKPLHQQSPRSGERAGGAQTPGLAMGVSRVGTSGREDPGEKWRQKRGSNGKPLAFLLLSRRRDGCIRLSRRQGGCCPGLGDRCREPRAGRGALILLNLKNSGRNVLPQMAGHPVRLLGRLGAGAPPPPVVQGLPARSLA